MADTTLTLVPWAPGTPVGAYPRRSEQLRPDGPPTGIPPADTQIVTDTASLTYDLPDGEYWAAAPLNGSGTWQYVAFVAELPFDEEGHALAAAQSENGHWHEVMVDDIGRLSTVDLGPSQPPHGPPPYATLGELTVFDERLDAVEATDTALDTRLDVVETKIPNAAWDQTAPTNLQEPFFSAALSKIKFRDPTAVKVDVRSGATGAANSDAIDAAMAIVIPAGNPATTSLKPTRPIEFPAGTFDVIRPVLDLRSILGFEMRTAGEQSTIFNAVASMNSIMSLNGVAHCHLQGFLLKTKGEGLDPSVVVQRAFHLWWDNTVASATQAARSTTQNRFDDIGIYNCRYVIGAQYGRDGDTNQVDSDTTTKMQIVGDWWANPVTGVAATDTLTTVPFVNRIANGSPIMFDSLVGGAGLVAESLAAPPTTYYAINVTGTTTQTFQVSLTPGGAAVNFTTDITAGWFGPADLYQSALVIGHGPQSNNLLHRFGHYSATANRRNIHMKNSQASFGMTMLQHASIDIYLEGQQSFFAIDSGRSENSGRFIMQSGGTNNPLQVGIKDYNWNAYRIRPDGRWIQAHAPGQLGLTRVRTVAVAAVGLPAGIVPKIYSTPPTPSARKLTFKLEGCVFEQPPDTIFDVDATKVAWEMSGQVESSAAGGFTSARPGRWSNAGTGGAIVALDIGSLPSLDLGEETCTRAECGASSIGLTTQTLRLSYLLAKKTETITVVRYVCVLAAAATPTLIRFGVYLVDPATLDLSLIASTPNDTTLFGTPAAGVPKALSASFDKVAGQRYAVGALVVSGVTGPTVNCASIPSSESGIAPRACAVFLGQADLPASITAAQQAPTSVAPRAVLLP